MAPLGAGSGMVSSGVRVELQATAPPRYEGFDLPFRYLPVGLTLRSVTPGRIPPAGRFPDGGPAPASSAGIDPRPQVSGGRADPPVHRSSRAPARQQTDLTGEVFHMSHKVLDYSFARFSPAQVHNLGAVAVCRYLTVVTPDTKGKLLTRAEAE